MEELTNAIDAAEIYRYQYNLKIVGLPMTAEQEPAEATATLCLNLFEAMGIEGIGMMDIDIAHRIPARRRSSSAAENVSDRPDPVICKFSRRLAKEKVLAKRKEAINITYRDLGLTSDATVRNLAIYEHLTPRLQELLFEAKKFQTGNNYQFCWAKGSTVLLRASNDSRIIKLRSMSDLENLIRREPR